MDGLNFAVTRLSLGLGNRHIGAGTSIFIANDNGGFTILDSDSWVLSVVVLRNIRGWQDGRRLMDGSHLGLKVSGMVLGITNAMMDRSSGALWVVSVLLRVASTLMRVVSALLRMLRIRSAIVRVVRGIHPVVCRLLRLPAIVRLSVISLGSWVLDLVMLRTISVVDSLLMSVLVMSSAFAANTFSLLLRLAAMFFFFRSTSMVNGLGSMAVAALVMLRWRISSGLVLGLSVANRLLLMLGTMTEVIEI